MMYKRLMLHCFGSLSNFEISELNFVIILNSFPIIIIIILNSHYNNPNKNQHLLSQRLSSICNKDLIHCNYFK